MLTTLLAGCEPTHAGEGPKPVSCTVVVDGPEKADTAQRIEGRVRFRCAKPGAERLSVKIRMEQKSGSSWKTVTSKSFTVKGSQTIAAELKYQNRTVSIGCKLGTFRTVVDWSRTSRGDTEGDNLISGSMSNPCKSLFGDR
ncbi:MAG: hypothetical protein HOV71_08960 [Hamadaea sp.]|uniref:hypothetical protein n=1 Tax=Hamadaea sp. NPDC050747 TaxID=3155789 RepID=UPI0017D4B3D6|nr:hypothetical protein [Hamadaea sp.]NUR48247.1 hypothetical protein [Hamadaea sp.]NUT08712.1 hypothetical protein [Hamadaea sp.]